MRKNDMIIRIGCVLAAVVLSTSLLQATVLTWEVTTDANVTPIPNGQLFGYSWVGRNDTDGYGHKVADGNSVPGEYWDIAVPGYVPCFFHYRQDGEGWTPNINVILQRPNNSTRYWYGGYTDTNGVLYAAAWGRNIEIVFKPDPLYLTVLHDFLLTTYGVNTGSITYWVREVTLTSSGEISTEGNIVVPATDVNANPFAAIVVDLNNFTTDKTVCFYFDDNQNNGEFAIDDIRFSSNSIGPNINVALDKKYQLSAEPYSGGYSGFKDTGGPEDFNQTHEWYRGELTDGVAGADFYDNVHIAQQGPFSVILDLNGVYGIDGFKIHLIGGGYIGRYLPTKIEAYALENPGTPMSYEKFCETTEPDDQNWVSLGQVTHDVNEDGTGYFAHIFELATDSNIPARLVKFVITDRQNQFGTTVISEIVIYSNDTPAPDNNEVVLVDFPPEGRDVFLPINLGTSNINLNRENFASGTDSGLGDAPYGQRTVMADIIKNYSFMQAAGT